MISLSAPIEYSSDYALWLEETIQKLRDRHYHQVDWDNLIEEIEAVGKSQKRELKNRLTTLLEHCLKRVYSNYTQDYRGWVETITRTQRELRNLLADSPSLKQHWHEIFEACYDDALNDLRKNPDYHSFAFPDRCPFSADSNLLLQQTFW